MSEHTRFKLKRSYSRPRYRESRNSKRYYARGNSKYDPWTDSYAEIPITTLLRYLTSNIGRPYDKVYSDLVKKLKVSHIPTHMVNHWLDSLFHHKGEDYYSFNPFYVSNGILNKEK